MKEGLSMKEHLDALNLILMDLKNVEVKIEDEDAALCMSTRSTSSNLFSPLRDPESLIRRRNLGEPPSLFDFEEVMSIPHNNKGPPPAGPPPPTNNGPPPVVRPNGPAPRSMEELCQLSISHNLCNMIITEFDCTQEFADEVGELRAIFGPMLGAAEVQIPEDNLDDLHSSREEDGTLETMDPQD
ncbi:hypothetical protein Tco_0441800 [Tanacetum coccineum]